MGQVVTTSLASDLAPGRASDPTRLSLVGAGLFGRFILQSAMGMA